MISEKDDFTDAQITFEADVNSIDTGNEQRDAHLKADDFFDANNYPKITFKSTKVEKKGDSTYKLYGDLTIKNITKPIELDVEYNGTVKDPWGQIKLGFEVNGKISRSDFGLKWNAIMETGGVMLSEEVKLFANIELQKQA
jgi:polyisoprenoid-binding protein YceI